MIKVIPGSCCTVGENIIGAPKMQNDFDAIKLIIFPMLQ